MTIYSGKHAILEETPEGLRILWGGTAFDVKLLVTLPTKLKAEYEFMKAVLFNQYMQGPLELYDLDTSDDVYGFLNDIQRKSRSLVTLLVQYGPLHRLKIQWDVLDDFDEISSLEGIPALLEAVAELNIYETKTALSVVENAIKAREGIE